MKKIIIAVLIASNVVSLTLGILAYKQLVFLTPKVAMHEQVLRQIVDLINKSQAPK